jgi:HPt (histidine-containing phosphotransfer) domain-containing protein
MASDYGARIEFTSSLSDRLTQIRWALTQLRQRPHDTGLFAETHNSVQELAAAAASFGLEELAEIGMRVDQALVTWRSRGSPPAAWAAVADADAALAEFADRVAPIAPATPWRMVGAGR